MAALRSGDRLGPYEITSSLGVGATWGAVRISDMSGRKRSGSE